jgi:hypothetical protein
MGKLVRLLRTVREAQYFVEEIRQRGRELAAGLAEQVLRGIALRIEIDDQHAGAARGAHCCEVTGDGGFADTALVVEHDPSHGFSFLSCVAPLRAQSYYI